jgi:hypothetical protein
MSEKTIVLLASASTYRAGLKAENGSVGQAIRNDAKSAELNRQHSNAIVRIIKLPESKHTVSSCWV